MSYLDIFESFNSNMRSLKVNDNRSGSTQLVSMQREMQKQMPMWVAVPISKETKGLEGLS